MDWIDDWMVDGWIDGWLVGWIDSLQLNYSHDVIQPYYTF